MIQSPGFPIQAAAIDIGSNALRLSIAEFSAPTEFTVLDSDRYPLRLGHDVFVTGKLAPQTIDSAVDGLRGFVQKIEAAGIRLFKAVATSAVRESKNGAELVRRAAEELELPIEVITGSEEARLAHLAVRSRVPMGKDRWILVDLGGGSVEVSLVDETGILWSESHTMGSVRLLEELTGSGHEPGRFARLLKEYISTLRVPATALSLRPAGFIGTGGNIESLARLAVAGDSENGVSTLPLAALKSSIATLSRLSFHQRIRELDLREDRADVILPAAVVYERLADLAGVEEIVVPHVGIREGLLIDLMENLLSYEQAQGFQSKQTWENAVNLGRRYMFEEPHALQVTRLALSLFDQLAGLHGLGEEERQLLMASGILHDIGFFISYKKHHKHSHYLISNSELPGFSTEEMQVVANVARYHRKSEPSERHSHYAELSANDKERVNKLAALLRMADALDREHQQNVESVEVKREGRSMILLVQGSGDLVIESWGLQKKSDLFQELFDVELRLQIERAEQDRGG